MEKSYFLEQDPPVAPPSAQEAAEPYKAQLTERDELTEHEREHIELYRELDERGRNAVDDLTDLHVERVRESTEKAKYELWQRLIKRIEIGERPKNHRQGYRDFRITFA